MASKAVTNRQKSTELVIAIGEAQAEALSRATPGAADVAGALIAKLVTTRDAMVEADEAHERELGDDAALREARDEKASALYARAVELREVLAGLYGGKFASDTFGGATPKDPVVLARFADELAVRLAESTPPPSRVPGVQTDAAALAAGLAEPREALVLALEAVAREVREAQATLEAKQNAIAAHDVAFRGVTNVLAGFLELAGHADLASRVRPSWRRPGRTVQEADEAAAADAGAPAA